MFKKSLTRKLVILFFIVGASALTVIGTYSYFNAKNAILKRTLDQLTSIRVIKKSQIEFFFQERFKNLAILSNSNYIKDYIKYFQNGDTSCSNFENYVKIKSGTGNLNFKLYGFSQMYIVCNDKKNELTEFIINNSLKSRIENDSSMHRVLNELYQKVIKTNQPCMIDFTKRFADDNDPVCLIGKIIPEDKGQKKCMIALQIPVKAINEIMLENNRENGLGNSGEIYLVGQDYLMRSNSRFIKNSVMRTVVNTVSVRNAFKNKVGLSLIDDYRTVACLSSFDKILIPDLHWAIIAEIDYAEAMIPVISIRNDIIFLSILICVFLFSIAHIISRSITQPIINLKNAALKIGEGKFNVNLQHSSGDEIGLLTEAFNTMSAQLKDERLKRMTALYDGQELERQRISRELHDGLGQKLVAIKLMLESTVKQDFEHTTRVVNEAKVDFVKAIEEVREISNNLAPNILKESGIDVALKNLCISIQHSSDIEIEFSAYGDFFTDDPKIKTYIYRIAQESLNNTLKHASASRIQLQLMGNKEFIILILEDNGKGFVFEHQTAHSGNGIYNMKERALLLSGTLDIESEIGVGTTIRLKIPKNSVQKGLS